MLKGVFKNIVVTWHCLAHRHELAVGNTIAEVTDVNHFKLFLGILYSLYSQSPKNKRELQVCAAEVGSEIMKIGKILDTRWVASSFRTANAVWRSFPALCKHFHDASVDMSRDAKKSMKYEASTKVLKRKCHRRLYC